MAERDIMLNQSDARSHAKEEINFENLQESHSLLTDNSTDLSTKHLQDLGIPAINYPSEGNLEQQKSGPPIEKLINLSLPPFENYSSESIEQWDFDNEELIKEKVSDWMQRLKMLEQQIFFLIQEPNNLKKINNGIKSINRLLKSDTIFYAKIIQKCLNNFINHSFVRHIFKNQFDSLPEPKNHFALISPISDKINLLTDYIGQVLIDQEKRLVARELFVESMANKIICETESLELLMKIKENYENELIEAKLINNIFENRKANINEYSIELGKKQREEINNVKEAIECIEAKKMSALPNFKILDSVCDCITFLDFSLLYKVKPFILEKALFELKSYKNSWNFSETDVAPHNDIEGNSSCNLLETELDLKKAADFFFLFPWQANKVILAFKEYGPFGYINLSRAYPKRLVSIGSEGGNSKELCELSKIMRSELSENNKRVILRNDLATDYLGNSRKYEYFVTDDDSTLYKLLHEKKSSFIKKWRMAKIDEKEITQFFRTLEMNFSKKMSLDIGK
ncbi:hypothetical protein SteCoe_19646 [Stentor coeruleus]|uniref:Uncharacterized protein n=1 Tax=Stentor coeruleus TaxID=5963 RepID=A0A1R2BTK6_9CILI|nr:hypothetical protein SteCoe_19646 [Stentor coeruleus]